MRTASNRSRRTQEFRLSRISLLGKPVGRSRRRQHDDSVSSEYRVALGAVQEVRQLTLEIQGLRTQLGLPGVQEAPTAAPTLEEFAPRFLNEYAKANRQKPRAIESKECILRLHWIPRIGDRPLNLIRDEDIQKLKADLADYEPKTVNNILSTLSILLKVAKKWRLMEHLPCSIEPLPMERPQMRFFEFVDYVRLVQAAQTVDDPRSLVVVLLGGDAGLRLGEMIALEWGDLDWERERLVVQRSESKRIVTLPKNGHARYVPMTRLLLSTLQALRDAGKKKKASDRVLLRDNGKSASESSIRTFMGHARVPARLDSTSNLTALHILRHTFCSHLAMRGAPPIAIQHLAGHQDLHTTQRYMHLCPTEARNAIALLDDRNCPRPAGKDRVNEKPQK